MFTQNFIKLIARFVSYRGHIKKTHMKTILTSLPRTVINTLRRSVSTRLRRFN